MKNARESLLLIVAAPETVSAVDEGYFAHGNGGFESRSVHRFFAGMT